MALHAALATIVASPAQLAAAEKETTRREVLELSTGKSAKVFWASDPIQPDQTAMIVGDGFQANATVDVVRLDDSARSIPSSWPRRVCGSGVDARPLQANLHCLKFVIPKSLGAGVYACRVATDDGQAFVVLNRPHPIWLYGDQGMTATPGGFVRVFGRCLATPGRQAAICLRGPREVVLEASEASCWSLVARLPGDLPAGKYQVWVHHGCGGEAGWSEAQEFLVEESRPWPDKLFNVRELGAKGDGEEDDTFAVQAALDKARQNGGGVIFFPRGRYLVSTTLELPPRTVLRGPGRELAAICWPDLARPPRFLVHGQRGFAVEDLTLYASNYVHVLGNDVDSSDAGDVHVRRIRVRAVLYRGHLSPEQVSQRFVATLQLSTGGGDTLHLGGDNIEVVDSDLYGSGRSLFLRRGKAARIQRNKLWNGRWGWYCISGADGVAFEDNQLTGGDLMSTGGGINCLYGVSWSQNVFYARNRLGLLHGWDREAMTSDAGGGAYVGQAKPAGPRALELSSDPQWGPKDWSGAGVFILDGKGMGQYRRVTGWQGRRVEINAPWAVPPDDKSLVTVTMLQRNYYFIDNEFSDAGTAIQLYGMALGNVMSGNRSMRTGGFHNFGMQYLGVQPSWFNQWLDNVIVEGNAYQSGHDQHRLAGGAHLGVFAFPPSADWSSPLTLGTVVRGNRLENNAHIAIGGSDPDQPLRGPIVQEVVVEANRIARSDVGIWLRRAASGVLLRDNTFAEVDTPVLDPKEQDRLMAARRAELKARKGAIAHWSFEKVAGDTTADDSGNRFLARASGNVTFPPEGVVGRCAKFDGKSELTVSHRRLLQLSEFTIAAWIRPDSVDGRSGIVAKRTRNVAAPFVLTIQDGCLGFEGCDESGQHWSFNMVSPKVLEAGKWQHVAATAREGQGVVLHLNGKQIASKANNHQFWQNDDNLWIGRDAWGGRPSNPATPGYYAGKIDEVKIWSRALTDEEIRQEAVPHSK